jgi:hypothetical protein
MNFISTIGQDERKSVQCSMTLNVTLGDSPASFSLSSEIGVLCLPGCCLGHTFSVVVPGYLACLVLWSRSAMTKSPSLDCVPHAPRDLLLMLGPCLYTEMMKVPSPPSPAFVLRDSHDEVLQPRTGHQGRTPVR